MTLPAMSLVAVFYWNSLIRKNATILDTSVSRCIVATYFKCGE